MIATWQINSMLRFTGAGEFNGLGLLPTEYSSNTSSWDRTYDADFDGEGYVGCCDCPHCGDSANHYIAPSQFDCGNCGHRSE